MRPLPGVEFVQGDFTEDATRGQLSVMLAGARADVVLSDMAPNLSGNALLDQGITAPRLCNAEEGSQVERTTLSLLPST
eukprot:768221-Hanusia_phi.AAC.18